MYLNVDWNVDFIFPFPSNLLPSYKLNSCWVNCKIPLINFQKKKLFNYLSKVSPLESVTEKKRSYFMASAVCINTIWEIKKGNQKCSWSNFFLQDVGWFQTQFYAFTFMGCVCEIFSFVDLLEINGLFVVSKLHLWNIQPYKFFLFIMSVVKI